MIWGLVTDTLCEKCDQIRSVMTECPLNLIFKQEIIIKTHDLQNKNTAKFVKFLAAGLCMWVTIEDPVETRLRVNTFACATCWYLLTQVTVIHFVSELNAVSCSL